MGSVRTGHGGCPQCPVGSPSWRTRLPGSRQRWEVFDEQTSSAFGTQVAQSGNPCHPAELIFANDIRRRFHGAAAPASLPLRPSVVEHHPAVQEFVENRG